MYNLILTQETDTILTLKDNINNNDYQTRSVLKKTNTYKGFYNKLSYISGFLSLSHLKNITINSLNINHQSLLSSNKNYFIQLSGDYNILDFSYHEFNNNIYKIMLVNDGSKTQLLIKQNRNVTKLYTLKIDGDLDIDTFNNINNKYISTVYIPTANSIRVSVYLVINQTQYLYSFNFYYDNTGNYLYKSKITNTTDDILFIFLKNNIVAILTKSNSNVYNSKYYLLETSNISPQQYRIFNKYQSYYNVHIENYLANIDIIDNKYYLVLKDSANITTNILLNIHNDSINGSLFILNINNDFAQNKYEIIYSLNNNIYKLNIIDNQSLTPSFLFTVNDDIMNYYYYVDNNIINLISKNNNHIINYNLINKNKVCFTNDNDIYSYHNRVLIKIYDNGNSIFMDYNIVDGILLNIPSEFPNTKDTLYLYYNDNDDLKPLNISTTAPSIYNGNIIVSTLIYNYEEKEQYQINS